MNTVPDNGRTVALASRLKRSLAASATALLLALAVPAGSADAAPVDESATEARLLKQLYLIGLSRVARGDPEAAIGPFQVVTEVAPELHAAHHLLATSMLLADFGRRERALPIIDKALAAEPAHPVYNLVRLLADASMSRLESDGALVFTAFGARRVETLLPAIAKAPKAYNARYLAAVLHRLERSPDAAAPLRLPRFAAMLGANGKVALAKLESGVAFGRLFAVSIPDESFAPHVRVAMARLPDGVQSLGSGIETPGLPPTGWSGQHAMELLVDHPRGRRRPSTSDHAL